MSARINEFPLKEAGCETVGLFRKEMQGVTATIEAHVKFPTGYRVVITKVSDDGKFEGVLTDSAPHI